MRRRLLITFSVVFFAVGASRGQTRPADAAAPPDADWPTTFPSKEEVQKEAEKFRTATGGWTQVASIRSMHKTVPIPDPKKQLSHPWRHAYSIIRFIDNDRFAVADSNHPIRIFNAADGKQLVSMGRPEVIDNRGRDFVVSPDGRYLTILPDPKPVIYDTQTGQPVAELPEADRYDAGSFSADGLTLTIYQNGLREGRPPGKLQQWSIDPAARRIMPGPTAKAMQDGRSLLAVGPYLVIKGHRENQIFDRTRLEVVLDQRPDDNEEFLYVQPPTVDQAGVYASILYYAGRNARWKEQRPMLRLISLADGSQLKQWPLPLKESDSNDHRFQAGYFISPDHKTFAISPEGRVDIFDFLTGQLRCSFPATFYVDHPAVSYVTNNTAIITQQRNQNWFEIVDLDAGKAIATVPEDDDYPIVSPNGRYIIARRQYVPMHPGKPWKTEVGEMVYAVWTQTAH